MGRTGQISSAIADAAHHRCPVWREARWGSQRVAAPGVRDAMGWVLAAAHDGASTAEVVQ